MTDHGMHTLVEQVNRFAKLNPGSTYPGRIILLLVLDLRPERQPHDEVHKKFWTFLEYRRSLPVLAYINESKSFSFWLWS